MKKPKLKDKEFKDAIRGVCKVKACNNDATALIRDMKVCCKCFDIIKKDNIKLNEMKVDLPAENLNVMHSYYTLSELLIPNENSVSYNEIIQAIGKWYRGLIIERYFIERFVMNQRNFDTNDWIKYFFGIIRK